MPAKSFSFYLFSFTLVVLIACNQDKTTKNQSSSIGKSKDDKSTVSPLDNSANTDSVNYRKQLVDFLTNPAALPDSLIKPIDTSGIPGLDIEKYTGKKSPLKKVSKKKRKSSINFKNGIFLISKTGKSLTFKNVKGSRKQPGKQFKFCAYDNLYNTLYMAEMRKDSSFTVFGVCLNTGDIFDLYKKDTLSEVQSQYVYSFSPNYRWLLKTGQDEGNFSCLLLDVSTGNEMTFVENSANKYTHFAIKPSWINNTDFAFIELNLEFEGAIYNKDYNVYLAALKQKNFDAFKIKNLPLKGTKFEFRIKPGYTSTELLKKSQVAL